MKNLFNIKLSARTITILEWLIIVGFALVPLLATYPFRINIFLSYEGAYRMYQGQMPFRDFYIPMGYGYWVIPYIFFHIFGPYLSTLVKAQVLINIASGAAFRSIGKSLGLKNGIRLLGVFLFTVSFSFFNFWPWYNHTVIVFEFIAIAFMLLALNEESSKRRMWIYSSLAALFAFWSFFTKQDGGFFAVVVPGVLALYVAILRRDYKVVLRYVLPLAVITLLVVGPLIHYNFLYWFNYGQEPHYGRFSLFDIFNEFFDKSQAIKFYLLVFVIIVISRLRKPAMFFQNSPEFLFALLTLMILGQAALLQVTSYTPPDGNIYFHSFAFIFIISNLNLKLNFSRVYVVLAGFAFIFLWWSGIYWKYASRTVARMFPEKKVEASASSTENRISIRTYKLEGDSLELDKSTWKLSGFKAFDKVYMPIETIDGIKRLSSLPAIAAGHARVLNMSELTPLAHEFGYELEKNQPLWYHLGVGMFNNELEFFRNRIVNSYYDVVLFEIIPNLNNFYPEELRAELIKHYDKVDVFQAPRRNKREVIEVYVRRKP